MDTTIEAVPPLIPAKAPRIGGLALSLAAMAALADVCFWEAAPRLSVGVFAIAAAGLILANRPGLRWNRGVILLVALICGGAVESAIDFCFSNVVVLLALIVALAGESYYEPLRSGWSRWSEQLWTMVKTPARWVRLSLMVAEAAGEKGPPSAGGIKKMARAVWIIGPGLLVTGFFALVLGSGNALFAKFAGDLLNGVVTWVEQLNLNVYRFTFWGVVIFVSLPLLWPSPPPKKVRFWARELPLLPEVGARTARLQSATMLGMLNVLFCCVNTIDAIYLWAHQALPAGVDYHEFMHSGANSLIVAVIFSAFLLTAVFHQPQCVAKWLPLRGLGLLWIAQNLALLASVFLRVKLSVDATQLTVVRVNLMFFILLVATGFILLAIHVWGKRTLGWLLNANMLATFFLFYTVQFLDTNGFVARYNVNQWIASHGTRVLDVGYLKSLGSSAYSAMMPISDRWKGGPQTEAADILSDARMEGEYALTKTPWQSWQLRDYENKRKLIFSSKP